MVKEKEQWELSEQTSIKKPLNIVLFNDDFNTFDFVIDTLIEVCNHTPEQAETCTWIVHYKGRCEVKSGVAAELKPICKELLNRNLTASIE